jgi:hypothetical protein
MWSISALSQFFRHLRVKGKLLLFMHGKSSLLAIQSSCGFKFEHEQRQGECVQVPQLPAQLPRSVLISGRVSPRQRIALSKVRS